MRFKEYYTEAKLPDVIPQLGEYYHLILKPFKAKDKKVYNIFEIFTGGRGWSGKYYVAVKDKTSFIVRCIRECHTDRGDEGAVFEIMDSNLHGCKINKRPYVNKQGNFRVLDGMGSMLGTSKDPLDGTFSLIYGLTSSRYGSFDDILPNSLMFTAPVPFKNKFIHITGEAKQLLSTIEQKIKDDHEKDLLKLEPAYLNMFKTKPVFRQYYQSRFFYAFDEKTKVALIEQVAEKTHAHNMFKLKGYAGFDYGVFVKSTTFSFVSITFTRYKLPERVNMTVFKKDSGEIEKRWETDGGRVATIEEAIKAYPEEFTATEVIGELL